MERSDGIRNCILTGLPARGYLLIAPHLQQVSSPLGAVVAHPSVKPAWVHFPITGVLASMVVLEDGSTVKASTICNEGMDGQYLVADPAANPYRINVQVPGKTLRMASPAFRVARDDGTGLAKLLMRHGLFLIQRGVRNRARSSTTRSRSGCAGGCWRRRTARARTTSG
jgi:hypothetical protein